MVLEFCSGAPHSPKSHLGKMGEACCNLKTFTARAAKWGEPSGAVSGLISQKEPRIQSYPGSRCRSPRPLLLLTGYLLWAGSEPNAKHASSHFALTVTYEVSHVLSILLMRKLKHRLVKQFSQCHTASKWWDRPQPHPGQGDSMFFLLSHDASC